MPDNDNKTPTVLDEHRGMASQKATEVRRRRSGVKADLASIRNRQAELEKFLFAAPAESWTDAANKALYVFRLFAATDDARNPRTKQLIDDATADLKRLRERERGS